MIRPLFISGALTLLNQFFPHQRPDQHIDRLCRTASLAGLTSFEAGCDLIDFQAAAHPVGTTSIATSASTASAVPAAGSTIMTSTAVSFAGPDILVRDSLDYPFAVPFEVFAPRRPDDLVNLLDEWTRPPEAIQLPRTPLAFAEPHTTALFPSRHRDIAVTAFYATERDPATVRHETVVSAVTPPRRNVQLGASWSPNHLTYGHLQATWVYQSAPGHRAAKPDNALLAAYTLRW